MLNVYLKRKILLQGWSGLEVVFSLVDGLNVRYFCCRRCDRRGGGTHLLLALVIGPLTTRPFRDGARILLLIETPPPFGRSLRRFHML